MQYTYLVHYASEYYDPEKAHQYYEEHKKLKGRRLTSEGQNAKQYITSQINERRTAATESAKDALELAKTKRDDQVKDARSQTSIKSAMLYQQLLSMSAEEKRSKGPQLLKQINSLKKENAAEKQKAYEEYASNVETIRTSLQEVRDKLTADLEREMNALLGDDEMSEEATSGKSSKSGSSADTGSDRKPLSEDQKKRISDYVEHMKERQKES